MKDVHQVVAQVTFTTSIPIEVPRDDTPHERYEHTLSSLRNKYGYLVDEEHADSLAFSIEHGLATPDPVETRIANLYMKNAYAGTVEMHGGVYILHVYKVEGEEDFSLTVPVQARGTTQEERTISRRLAEGIIRQQAQTEEIQENLRTMLLEEYDRNSSAGIF